MFVPEQAPQTWAVLAALAVLAVLATHTFSKRKLCCIFIRVTRQFEKELAQFYKK
jgi:hypothetical protein